MRALVAAACICVIAATGYYFVGEYRAHQAVAAVAADEPSCASAWPSPAACWAIGKAAYDDCQRTAQRGYELHDSRMISKGERCLAGIE